MGFFLFKTILNLRNRNFYRFLLNFKSHKYLYQNVTINLVKNGKIKWYNFPLIQVKNSIFNLVKYTKFLLQKLVNFRIERKE